MFIGFLLGLLAGVLLSAAVWFIGRRNRNWQKLSFCPRCQHKLSYGKVGGSPRHHCTRCGFVFWDNPRPVAITLVPHTDGKRLVLVKRKFNPQAGKYALPGGFVEPFEHPLDAARRETREETTLDVEIDRLLAVLSPTTVNEVHFYYLAKPTSQVPEHGDDAEEVGVYAKDSLPGEIAFELHKLIIDQWFGGRFQPAATPV
jgi:ADP-ribose pyrophosphatase YjhB (NUDIX family)